MLFAKYIIYRIIAVLLICGMYTYTFGEIGQNGLPSDPDDSIIYYLDYSDLLAFRIYTNTKWNALDIIKDENTLQLRPNAPTALGVGFNYKSYGLGIAIGIPKSASSNEKYGKTNRFDLQANVYSQKIGIDGFAQFYKGYYVANPEDFMEWENDYFPLLPEMKIYSIGLNAFYIFNSNKFSYKAAFVRNQVQKKSAGSLISGIFGQLDVAETEQGFIPQEFPDSIRLNFDLKAFNTLAVGVTVGYLYTWVISKKFFLNIGVTPGFGLQAINLETIAGEKSTEYAPAGQLAARGALGFDSKYFYVGITGFTIWRSFKYKGYELGLATEQLRFFIGKRFDLSKKR